MSDILSSTRAIQQVPTAATAVVGGDLEAAILWYRSEPLAPFDCRTAASLVAEGRAADVLNLLESIQADSSDLLFLDVDGVLHPIETDYPFGSRFFSHLPLLEELLREFGSVDVVISSDWRLADGFEQLQRYFSEDIRHRLIGGTPQIYPNKNVDYRRQLGPHAWLEGNGRSGSEWVVLDDWASHFEAGFKRLVLTDPSGRSIKTASKSSPRISFGSLPAGAHRCK